MEDVARNLDVNNKVNRKKVEHRETFWLGLAYIKALSVCIDSDRAWIGSRNQGCAIDRHGMQQNASTNQLGQEAASSYAIHGVSSAPLSG